MEAVVVVTIITITASTAVIANTVVQAGLPEATWPSWLGTLVPLGCNSLPGLPAMLVPPHVALASFLGQTN